MQESFIDKASNLIKNNLLYSLVIVYLAAVCSILIVPSLIEKKGSSEEIEITTEEIQQLSSSKMFVEIAGAIRSPGVYELSSHDRLHVLIDNAGGFTEDASVEWLSKFINLAAPLDDAQKVYIPFKWDAPIESYRPSQDIAVLTNKYAQSSIDVNKDGLEGSSGQTDSEIDENPSSKVNVNTASQEDIDGLPGIGPVYAARMIENRPYDSQQDLVEKSGIPNSVLEKIKDEIVF